MLGVIGGTGRERFLYEELSRYIPELADRGEAEIIDFIDYQRGIYLDGAMPKIGPPIASLNPMFSDSVDALVVAAPERRIYTRASVKENGFRMQNHRGPGIIRAWSRQFTPYDLRMFPELTETFEVLPVMIGDPELACKNLKHNAALNALQDIRLPGAIAWPKKGETRLSNEALRKYLNDPRIFESPGKPHHHLELTLVFHGLFAIAHPSTWDKSRTIQMENMISLCQLPIDYEKIDKLMAKLGEFIREHGLNARIAQRFTPTSIESLKWYIDHVREEGEEGVCIVQTIRDEQSGRLLVAGHAIKVKEYETIDMALIGLHLKKAQNGLTEENIEAATLGLYDEYRGMYLPAAKVNLDPTGKQIKTDGQKERLIKLRREICEMVSKRPAESEHTHINTLYEVYLLEGENVLTYLLKDYPKNAWPFRNILHGLPRGYDLVRLYELFKENEEGFRSTTIKRNTTAKEFIHAKIELFRCIDRLDKKGMKRFRDYFSSDKANKERSGRMKKPNLVVSTDVPVIVEAKVFNLKWGKSPYPAGFHSWYPHESFYFSNNFAERIRYDKRTTTDFPTIHVIARRFTPKKSRKKDSSAK